MAIVSESDKKEMSEKKQKEYCIWCFHHDYGHCDVCALKDVLKPK